MILINLLPHREEKRRRRRVQFFAGLGAAAVAGVLVVAGWYLTLQHLTSAQVARNTFLRGEIEKLEGQIKDIATLRAEIDALKARQKAVEDLQTDRNVPVYLLNELVRQAPEGVYLTAIRQTGGTVAITGIAQTNERVSEFLRNTLYNAKWLERPELVEIKVAGSGNPRETSREAAAREQRRLFEFSMRVSLRRPGAPTEAASGPARGASAPKS